MAESMSGGTYREISISSNSVARWKEINVNTGICHSFKKHARLENRLSDRIIEDNPGSRCTDVD